MNKYKHGDAIQVKPSIENKSIRVASIVGITVVETADMAKHFNASVGTVFYTVEFPDGSDALVPEDFVQLITETE